MMKCYRAVHAEARERREKLLPGLGWAPDGRGHWRSPRCGLRFPTDVAIAAEQLRGGIVEVGKCWKIRGLYEREGNHATRKKEMAGWL